MSNASKYRGFRKGDFITLSTTQVIEDHSDLEITMQIDAVQSYEEPHGTFNYTAYICTPDRSNPEGVQYMLMLREVGEVWELMWYYRDMSGHILDARELVLDDSGEDFENAFTVDIKDKEFDEDIQEGDKGYEENQEHIHEVTWTKKPGGTFFGIEFSDGVDEGIKTIGEYNTDDDSGGHQHGFLEWIGDDEEGWAEFWVGSEIKEFEVKLFSAESL